MLKAWFWFPFPWKMFRIQINFQNKRMEAGPTDITNDQKNLILAKISDMCGRQARAGGRRHPIVLAPVENNRPLSPHCTETKDWFKYSSWYWSGPGHVTLRQRQQEIWLPDRSEPSKEGAGGSLGRQPGRAGLRLAGLGQEESGLGRAQPRLQPSKSLGSSPPPSSVPPAWLLLHRQQI